MMWIVYYSDGSSLSSDEYTPFNLPRRRDVQVIAQEDKEHNWVTVPAYDYYMWDARYGEPQWYAGDINGLFQYLDSEGEKAVLFGTWIDKHQYRKILSDVTERLGNKQGYDARETIR